MEATVKVMGGLEITVEFTMYGAEPDVGIMSDGVEEWSIIEIAGRPLRKKESADWLYRRIEATKGTEDKILEACYEAIEGYRQQAEEDAAEARYYDRY